MTVADYDSPWKEILDRYFEAFMAFFFPLAYRDIDWEQGYEFLNQELQQVVRDATTGGRRVDKLARVWLKDGEVVWVLIHIEVQGQKDVDFAERMYIYNYRLYDRHRCKIASFAVLTDEHAHWRPHQFVNELWGSRAGLDFPTIKLLNYREKWLELEQDDNPFAVVVMAHLKTLETRRQPRQRQQWKFALTRMLYERGYAREDILELYRFVDWLMILPPDLEEALQVSLEEYEEGQRMKYVTTIERWAEKRGSERTLRTNIVETLQLRFGYVPEAVEEELTELDDLPRLKALFKEAVLAESLEAFEGMLSSL